MTRAWFGAAAIGGFLSVMAGAIAAHLPIDHRATALVQTGAQYGMVHAAALVAVAVMAETRSRPNLSISIAGWSFAGGMLLFSVSLFALALTGVGWFGFLTPLGGVGLLLGWMALGAHALTYRR